LTFGGFSVDNENLLYKGKPVGDDESRPGFHQFSFESTALGEGGNGVTFRVQHRTLEVDQVVKLYFPSHEGVSDKAKFEAIKNADPRVRDVIAQVHDAGTYHYPEEIAYSIMESVSGIQTLNEWLSARDAQWEFAQASADSDVRFNETEAQRWKGRRSRTVMAEALNVAAGFIGAVVRMHSTEVIHGDLNPGNILILQEDTDPVWSSFELQGFNQSGRDVFDPKYGAFRLAHNKYLEQTASEAQPGTLNPPSVKVIDLGSSQASGTNPQVGIARENWFVLDNLRRILKPLFDKQQWGMKDRFSLEKIKTDEQVITFRVPGTKILPEPRDLTSDIFRLLCVLNILLGHLHNARDFDADIPNEDFKFHHTDLSILNELVGGELTSIRDEIFGIDVLAVLRVIPESPTKTYVRWGSVIEHWGRMHPGFERYKGMWGD
jgi:serine/threonine protein kinase